MPSLALNLNMQGKLSVIIGGGSVALRKLRILLDAGSSVRVVAPELCGGIMALQGQAELETRCVVYSPEELEGAFLVVAATDTPSVNRQVCTDARRMGMIVIMTDDSAAGDGSFPATLRHGDLEIAVSTGGRCPTFAVDVRDEISRHISHEYASILDRLSVEREKLLTNGSPSTYNIKILRSLSRRLLTELVERKDPLP